MKCPEEFDSTAPPDGSSSFELVPEDADTLDISIVICTRNRAESLGKLLECLRNDPCDGVSFEVVVVDNGDCEHTRGVVSSFERTLRVRYLLETRPGKCFCMNRALDEGCLGRILAVLDDDLTLEPGWLQGVRDGCDRWPEHDIFSGRSHVIFPENMEIPDWAFKKEFEGWAFSVNDPGEGDREIGRGFFPSGNHFWVRSRVLVGNRRFPELWLLSDAGFVMGLHEDGYKGVWIGDVVAGHRIQPHLLEPDTVLRRMVQYGKDFPYIRMPHERLFWHARVFRRAPIIWVVLCLVNSLRWFVKCQCSGLHGDFDRRFLERIKATTRLYDNLETVCHWGRIRRFVADGRIQHTEKEARELGRIYGRS